jgi:hypothetical protein
VYEYWTVLDKVSAEDLWDRFKAADDLNYLMGAGTDGTDSQFNTCGVTAGHAFTMMSVFELKTGETVDHKMYMLRNPWGKSH